MASSISFQTNTFQGVLVTNNTASFYAFSYACGDIEWSGQGFETAIVGYNSHADYFSNHPANGIPDIGQIVSCTRRIIPTGGRRKRQVVMEGDGNDEPAYGAVPCNAEVKGNAERCTGLAQLDQASIPDANNLQDDQNRPIFEVLPACPPTQDLVEISTMFNRLEDSTNCYISTMTFEPFNPVGMFIRVYRFASICCYDPNK